MQNDDQWIEDEDKTGDPSEEISFSEYDIASAPNDFNVKTLNDFLNSGIVRIPGFQRNYVWDIKRASKLIESIIIGIPIPQIFLFEEGRNKFIVVDGQQRYMTIYFFMKKRFPIDEKRVELRKVFSEYKGIPDKILHDNKYFSDFNLDLPIYEPEKVNPFNGKNYETLEDDAKTTFELRTIRNVIIKQNFPKDDDSVVYEIFNRLNSGGMNLSAQEIRSCLYHSAFMEMISRINLNVGWRSLIKQPIPDLHMKDIEVLLRGFSMLINGKNYKPSMTKFINAFAKSAKQMPPEDVAFLEKMMSEFINICQKIDAEIFIGKSGKFNISVFESIFVACCFSAFESRSLDFKIPTNININALKQKTEFIDATQSRTAGVGNVKNRIRLAKEML